MIIGILKEIKTEEHRVAMTPAGVEVMQQNGHTVLVEKNAGRDSGFTNPSYAKAGAEIVNTPAEIYKRCDMVMHVKVYVLDTNLERLRYLSDIMPRNCFPLMSDPAVLRDLLKKADLVVGAVLIVGAQAPKIITRDMLKIMKKGAVIVDVAIDQGGCFETSRPTTHNDPIYDVDGIVHYCVANMPGGVADAFGLKYVPIDSLL